MYDYEMNSKPNKIISKNSLCPKSLVCMDVQYNCIAINFHWLASLDQTTFFIRYTIHCARV